MNSVKDLTKENKAYLCHSGDQNAVHHSDDIRRMEESMNPCREFLVGTASTWNKSLQP